MSNYYDILGLQRTCNKKDVTLAYRRLALKWHPDKNKDPNAHTMFVKISEAYQVLSDKNKRANYDYYYSPDIPDQSVNSTDTGNDSDNDSVDFNTFNSTSSNRWNFKFSNPFDLFRDFFPGLDGHLLGIFSNLLFQMKSLTDDEFILQLINEYKYFARGKHYNSSTNTTCYTTGNDNPDGNDNTDDNDDDAYLPELKSNKSSFKSISKNLVIPPDQIYELQISLKEYLEEKIIRIKLPILAKCMSCSICHRDGCYICKGDIFYETERIFPIPLNEYEVYFPEAGNYLPNYRRACDFIIYCEDEKDKYFKRIGSYHIYAYVYWNLEGPIQFEYIDGKCYSISLNSLNSHLCKDIKYKSKANRPNNSYEPRDLANNIIRIDSMGLPDHSRDNKRGDLFINITQDEEYKQPDIVKYNIIDIDNFAVLYIDNILSHFTK